MAAHEYGAVSPARTRLSNALTKHLAADFEAHGADVIAELRARRPVGYLRLVAAVLGRTSAGDALPARQARASGAGGTPKPKRPIDLDPKLAPLIRMMRRNLAEIRRGQLERRGAKTRSSL